LEQAIGHNPSKEEKEEKEEKEGEEDASIAV
jgi:hypothetical protein